MDIFHNMCNSLSGVGCGDTTIIRTIDMHTSGEPTRIVLPGSFQLKGDTLLEKRAYAKEYCDHLRKRLMREPRGHAEMYGAILVQDTEETAAGCADIGVLFCHNEGYSTMCGHATIALGRFLIDAHDLSIFPRREQLKYDAEREETLLRLHAPCGVVQVRVPTLGSGQDARSDGTRRVSFKSVASFVSAIDVKVDIPESLRWTELKKAGRSFVTVDVSFGGAYYAIVSAEELGFERGIRAYPLSELSQATAVVKSLLRARKALFEHPSEEDLEYLYGVIIVEKLAQRKELGACFFADQQMDRSPCGSGVCACVALDLAKGNLGMGEEVVFESVVSMMTGQKGGFAGTAVERVVCGLSGRVWPGCVVRVQGRAFYTGAHVFVAEAAEDELADGFLPTTTPS